MPVICTKKAEADDEDRGAQERAAKQIAPRGGGAGGEAGGDDLDLLVDVDGGALDRDEGLPGLGVPAHHDVPAGGVGEAEQEQGDHGAGDRGESQHPAPALGGGEGHRDQVAEDDAGDGGDLVQHEEGAAVACRGGFRDEDRNDDDRDADGDAEQDAAISPNTTVLVTQPSAAASRPKSLRR